MRICAHQPRTHLFFVCITICHTGFAPQTGLPPAIFTKYSSHCTGIDKNSSCDEQSAVTQIVTHNLKNRHPQLIYRGEKM